MNLMQGPQYPDWDTADTSDNCTYGLDLDRDLGRGERPVSALRSIELVRGPDPDVQSRVAYSGADAVRATVEIEGTEVRAWAHDLVPGCRYRILFDVVTSQGRSLRRFAELECAAARVVAT